MFPRKFVILCTLFVPIIAVINSKTETKVERREAPFDTYGPPPQQISNQPIAIYGAPSIAQYPSPTPNISPPVSQQYGVPVLKYGPPKVHVEYGPPPQQQQQHHQQQHQIIHHQQHQQQNHGQTQSISLIDQIKNSLGFSNQNINSHRPHTSYGPPPPAPVNHFLPPKPHSKYGPPKPHNSYGPPTKPQLHYGVPHKPHTNYGPPPSIQPSHKPHTNYGPPKQHFSANTHHVQVHVPSPNYGLPLKPAINFNVGKPQQTYGIPVGPIRQPINTYGPPQLLPQSQSPIPSFRPQQQPQPSSQYGPPQQIGPVLNSGVRCDGWRPIPGPSIPIPNSNGGGVQSVISDNSYLPPPSNSLADIHYQEISNNGGLQLPVADAGNFHTDDGLGLTTLNVIKSEGIELHTNQLDSYSAPPADAFSPNYQRRPSSGLTPPSGSYGPPQPSGSYGPPQPSGSYGPPQPTGSYGPPQPSGSYGAPPSGLGIQHGSITGNLKQWPTNLNPPRQPVAFRAPVPQGLIESIGHSVQQQDSFGVKLQQQTVYLPPPTGEIPPPPHGLESLPLSPAAQFIIPQLSLSQDLPFVQQPRYQSGCSHGPNLGGGGQESLSSIQIPQLQSIYGVPNAPLDVSQSGFEIAQNTAQSNLLTSYGPPASGIVSNSNLLNNVHTHEVHEPSSSYGPPPSGNPADSLAYSSQKSSTIQIDSASANSNIAEKNTQTETETKSEDLPGLSGAGLDIISAQKSQTVEIPVQGQLGSYSLQFQSANPLSSQNNEIESPDHQKLLSEGLLQSILSAIEQPKSENVQQSTDENIQNHPDVEQFVHSVAGQETLGEPKTE